MKINLSLSRRAGYALIMVLIIGAISVAALSGALTRTGTVAIQNDRNNQYVVNLNAAESAVEKVIARMAYDFQGGLSLVSANLPLYRTQVPTNSESAYWNNFQFSNGQGQVNRTYVNQVTNYSGPLPSQYPGLFTINAPVYRVLSNVRSTKGRYTTMTNAVQTDVLLALVPLSQYAIFYNGLLEFSTCATMEVNGRTHANNDIYVGSSSWLTFNGTVTAAGKISAPKNNGSGPWKFPSGAKVALNGNPSYKTNVPAIALSISMTNTHSLIDMPPAGESVNSLQGQVRLYNQAHVLLLISNDVLRAELQASPGLGYLPGSDPLRVVITNSYNSTNLQGVLQTNFPFLQITNRFYDQRENKTNKVAQIDVAQYGRWIQTNLLIQGKFPASLGSYPTILYVADNRTTTANELTVVRITNGIAPPSNGGAGWSLATPNPLYVWGDYNFSNPAHAGTTNTTSTVPSAFLSDALTILSRNWKDSTSYINSSTGPDAYVETTVNAAILAGIKPSTSSSTSGFSGGVHNLPRLLEDWGNSHLWLNTSIINLYSSTRATGQFITPGSSSYYVPPTRHFSFDPNFLDPNKVPPGIPCALVAIRMNWAVPPPNKVDFYVSQ